MDQSSLSQAASAAQVLANKYDEIQGFMVDEIAIRNPKINELLNTDVVRVLIQAATHDEWNTILLKIVKDLNPYERFIFICAVQHYIRYDVKNKDAHFQVVSPGIYKFTAVAYGLKKSTII